MPQDFKPEIKTFFFVVLIAVVISVAGIFLLRNDGRNQVSPTPSPVPNDQSALDTSDWQTYRNEKFGFEFKYPQDFIVSQNDNSVEILFPTSYKGSSYTYKNDVTSASISFGARIMNKLGFSGDFCKIPIVGVAPDAKEVRVNNVSYIKSSTGDAAMGGFYETDTIYATLHNGNCYEIVLAVSGQGPGAGSNNGQGPLPQDYAPSDSEDKFISILDGVVSTFKFIDQTQTLDTSNWKTYINSEWGFQIKYPSNYKLSTDGSGTNIAPFISSEYVVINIMNYYKSGGFIARRVVNGIEMLEFPIGGNIDGGIEYWFAIPSKNLSLLFSGKNADSYNYKNEYDQILDTFRFVE